MIDRSRLGRRLTAAGGVYLSALLGFAGTLIVFRLLGPADAGRFAIVIGVVQFLALLIELTADEALVKFGFRYAAREDWPRFHRVVRVTFVLELATSVTAGLLVVGLAPFADSIFNDTSGLTTPLLIAAAVPVLQSMESMAAQILILRGRYEVRAALLTYSMGLRLAGLAIGAQGGVTGAVLGMVVAQAITTASILGVGLAALRRFPTAAPFPLGDDRRPFLRFVLQSSFDTALDSVRTWIAPLALGVVRPAADVGLFRAAQTPQVAFSVLSAPVRLILLTEQTQDWEHGHPERVIAGVRRYVAWSALLMLVVVPPVIWVMPWLIRTILTPEFEPATDAARLITIAAAIQLVFGWTKSFPVTIGRPVLRIVAHAVESAVLLPLVVGFGKEWGVTGAGGAVLVSSIAFAATWVVLALRLRGEHRRALARGSAAYFG